MDLHFHFTCKNGFKLTSSIAGDTLIWGRFSVTTEGASNLDSGWRDYTDFTAMRSWDFFPVMVMTFVEHGLLRRRMSSTERERLAANTHSEKDGHKKEKQKKKRFSNKRIVIYYEATNERKQPQT